MILQLGDIGHTIQLAIAPVFLLTGVGTNLTVLTNRLGRIIDRTRVIEKRLQTGPDRDCLAELAVLFGRSHLINYAIALSTACALQICLVIVLLFVGDTVDLPLDKVIAALFVLGMLCLICSFCFLMREIFIASKSLHLRHNEYENIDPR